MSTWTEQELNEQPEALQRFLDAEVERVLQLVPSLMSDDVKYIVVAARGTSDNAARYLQYLLGVFNRLPVMLATPSLYTIYDAPPKLDGALVVGISQSGASPDINAVLEDARSQGRPTLAITNVADSRLAQNADHVIELHAGEEHGVAATKTYTNSLAAAALFSFALNHHEKRLAELKTVPELLARQIAQSQKDVEAMTKYAHVDAALVVGRGVNYGTAFEIALKMRELSGLIVEPFSAADLMHGPIAALYQREPTIVVAPSGAGAAGTEELVAQLRQRGADVIVISDNAAWLEAASVQLPIVEQVPEWLSTFLCVIPGQFAALRLAQARGVDVDKPHGLSKVTLTT
jgi:glucosamine--fructose-6-phosphate aminotransferase (isomerizing)